MRWEKNQLRVVLELDYRRIVADRECELCGVPLLAGTTHCSIGVIDRQIQKKYRWYLCEGCEHFFNRAVEDSEPHVQQYLSDARFAEEVWIR